MYVMYLTYHRTLFQIFSFILSALVIHFIVKKLQLKRYDLKIANHKRSAIISLIVVLITVIIISPLVGIFMKVFASNGLKGSAAVIFFVITGLLQITPLIIITLLRKESLYSLGITKKNVYTSVLIGFISYIIYFAFMFIMKQYRFPFPTNSVFSLLSLVNFSLVAFAEEILIRGYLQTRLTEWLGNQIGLILTAFIFSFSHLIPMILSGNMNLSHAIISCISLFPIGLFLGYLFSKCKNIVPSTIFHTLYSFFMNYISIY